jgi:hypothetical protein
LDVAGVALFRGSMHVMEWANDELLSLSPRACIGIPLSESFPEPEFAEAQAAMDAVFHGAGIIKLARPYGTLILGPRTDARGRVFGVASWFLLDELKVAARPAPTLLLLPGLADRPVEQGAG